MSARSVTALVVTFESAHALPDCLRALTADGIPAIVADNGSGDATVAIAEGQGAQVIRRHGKILVINRDNPRNKARQG